MVPFSFLERAACPQLRFSHGWQGRSQSFKHSLRLYLKPRRDITGWLPKRSSEPQACYPISFKNPGAPQVRCQLHIWGSACSRSRPSIIVQQFHTLGKGQLFINTLFLINSQCSHGPLVTQYIIFPESLCLHPLPFPLPFVSWLQCWGFMAMGAPLSTQRTRRSSRCDLVTCLCIILTYPLTRPKAIRWADPPFLSLLQNCSELLHLPKETVKPSSHHWNPFPVGTSLLLKSHFFKKLDGATSGSG